MPPADPALRAALSARATAEGWPALHAELAQADPATAKRLAPHDAQRIQRALEVYHASGKPLSAWHAAGSRRGEPTPLAKTPLFSLEPQDRGWLHDRIAHRFDAMLAAGFVDEVRALRARGDLHPALPSMRCVGYRQAWAQLDAAGDTGASQVAGLDSALEQRLRDQGIFATRQLAKRQLTWLRGLAGRTVVPCDAPDALPRLLSVVRAVLA
jgi:tRNA dimethylallyltransferase